MVPTRVIAGTVPTAATRAQPATGAIVQPSTETAPTPAPDALARANALGHHLGRIPVHSRGTVPDAGRDPGGGPEPGSLLARMHALVIATGNEVLGDRWTPAGCPDIHAFFTRHEGTDPADLEKILRRYGGTHPSASLDDAIGAANDRLRRSLQRWSSGEKMTWQMGASGLPVALEQEENGRGGASAVAVGDLGQGTPLDGATQARMETAFDARFDDVRVHKDTQAGEHTHALGADALAVGNHIAFAPGEHKPGSPDHDALMGHELAHVLQQRRAGAMPTGAPAPVQKSVAHEHDADRLADAAMARLSPPVEPPASPFGPARLAPSSLLARIPVHAAPPAAPLAPALASGPAVRLGNRKSKAPAKQKKPKDENATFDAPQGPEGESLVGTQGWEEAFKKNWNKPVKVAVPGTPNGSRRGSETDD